MARETCMVAASMKHSLLKATLHGAAVVKDAFTYRVPPQANGRACATFAYVHLFCMPFFENCKSS